MNQKETPLKLWKDENKNKLPIYLLKTAVLKISITEKIFQYQKSFWNFKSNFFLR